MDYTSVNGPILQTISPVGCEEALQIWDGLSRPHLDLFGLRVLGVPGPHGRLILHANDLAAVLKSRLWQSMASFLFLKNTLQDTPTYTRSYLYIFIYLYICVCVAIYVCVCMHGCNVLYCTIPYRSVA